MNVITCAHVEKSLGDFSIQDLNLSIPSGTICGLIGENGAGKSTVIRMLMGALRPDGGRISVLGTDVSSPAYQKTKEDIGVVLDEAYFPDSMNPRQVGSMLSRTYRRWQPDTYAAYLNRFQLPEKQPFKEFSRGMRMKLAIAAALSHQAKLLVLDEATAGLDPIVRDEILELFNEFTREEEHSILISSHILSDLEKLCDYIAFLHKGKLLFCREKDALLEEYGIFMDSRENLNCLLPEAVVAYEENGYGSVRAVVRRERMPAGFQLERASIEDVILAMVKGEAQK